MPRTNEGFTLVEMMVVVAIGVVLAALLMPGLSRAQAAAKRTQCASQLGQIYQLAMSYAADNNMTYIPASSSALNPTAPASTWWSWYFHNSPLVSYAGSLASFQKLVVCPLSMTHAVIGTTGMDGYPYVANYQVMVTASGTNGTQPLRITGTTHASSLIMMTDAATNGWGAGFASSTSGWTRVGTPHQGQVNVLWCDGHVSLENKGNLTNANCTP